MEENGGVGGKEDGKEGDGKGTMDGGELGGEVGGEDGGEESENVVGGVGGITGRGACAGKEMLTFRRFLLESSKKYVAAASLKVFLRRDWTTSGLWKPKVSISERTDWFILVSSVISEQCISGKQSCTLLNQGCLLISSMVARVSGSTTSIRPIKLAHAGET